jgi:hypothetical protein
VSPSQRSLPDNINTEKRQASMPTAGFENAIPASKRQQTHALDSAATRIRYLADYFSLIYFQELLSKLKCI